MKEKFLNNSLNTIRKYSLCNDKEDDVLLYGLEGIYLTVTKLIVITILAIILNIFKELIILLLMFNILRFVAFGFHANNSIECLIFSGLLFIVLPYVFKNIFIDKYILLIIGVLCLILIMIYAPADTKKRPLKNKRKRIIRKIFSCIISVIYIISSMIINNHVISNLFILSLIIQVIMILPITYIAFKQTYRNYKL